MRGSLGLVIGLVVGAGAMYLALRPPWGGAPTSAPIDAGVAIAPADAAKPRPKRPRRTPTTAPGGPAGDPGEQPGEQIDEPIELSAADRALEWRGDDVTLPTQRIDMAGGAEPRALDDAEINSTISAQSTGVRDCVVRGATGTDLRATITIKLIVDGSGRVTRSRLHAPRYLFDHGLLGCAQRALGRIRFPATGAPTLVTLPVNLG